MRDAHPLLAEAVVKEVSLRCHNIAPGLPMAQPQPTVLIRGDNVSLVRIDQVCVQHRVDRSQTGDRTVCCTHMIAAAHLK